MQDLRPVEATLRQQGHSSTAVFGWLRFPRPVQESRWGFLFTGCSHVKPKEVLRNCQNVGLSTTAWAGTSSHGCWKRYWAFPKSDSFAKVVSDAAVQHPASAKWNLRKCKIRFQQKEVEVDDSLFCFSGSQLGTGKMLSRVMTNQRKSKNIRELSRFSCWCSTPLPGPLQWQLQFLQLASNLETQWQILKLEPATATLSNKAKVCVCVYARLPGRVYLVFQLFIPKIGCFGWFLMDFYGLQSFTPGPSTSAWGTCHAVQIFADVPAASDRLLSAFHHPIAVVIWDTFAVCKRTAAHPEPIGVWIGFALAATAPMVSPATHAIHRPIATAICGT